MYQNGYAVSAVIVTTPLEIGEDGEHCGKQRSYCSHQDSCVFQVVAVTTPLGTGEDGEHLQSAPKWLSCLGCYCYNPSRDWQV